MNHFFCIHSSVEGYLGSFQLLAIINKATMNIVEHVSFLLVGTFSGHLIFDKGAKTIHWKKTAFSTNGPGTTGGYHVEECKLIHFYLLVLRSNLSGLRNSTSKTKTTKMGLQSRLYITGLACREQ